MISFLNGLFCEATEDTIVVEAGGVGYQVFVPQSVIAELPLVGDPIKVYTYHYIREDQQSLFGFISLEERQLFGTLITVSGVGPKVGIKFFSTLSSGQLISAVLQEDIAVLTSVPGVGKKLAERLVIELKDKLPKQFQVDMSGVGQKKSASKPLKALGDDLAVALKQLGYAPDEIKTAIANASAQLDETMSLEAALRIVFKHLLK
jgi:Holliday junction DNA helicase RuvA